MLLLRFLGLLFDVVLLPLRLLSRRRRLREGTFLTTVIDGPVADVAAAPKPWQFRAQRTVTLADLAEMVEGAIAAPKIRGWLITLKRFDGGLATATSLRALLERMRDAGKEVVVHLPLGGGTKEIVVATAATSLFLGPAAQLAPVGFLTRSRYLKHALEKAGVAPEVFACGDYKSAGETLVRDAMSEPQREQVGALLDGFQDHLLDAIAQGRGVPRERASAIVDGAPYFGQAAVDVGLADGVAHEDEVLARLGLVESRRPGSVTARTMPCAVFLRSKRRPLLRRVLRAPYIAVIPVHGPIAHASSMPGSKVATDEHVARMARAARLDPRAVGVVLHVDSPGGGALASARMHHELAALAREKPLVACMGNVAASGGYFVVAPAAHVVCATTTVTGSIGVVGVRMSIDPLLARLGIVTETVRRGAHAGLLAPTGPLSDDERAALERELDATYRSFVKVVADGRRMDESKVESLARGRVYSGEHALAVGLVDELGGFPAALAAVRRMVKSKLAEDARPVVLTPPRKPLPVLDPPPGGAALLALLELLPPSQRALLLAAAGGERVLLLHQDDVVS